MNFLLDTTAVIGTLTAGLVLYAIKGITAINGAVKTLNEWRVNHEKLDDERHDGQKVHVDPVLETAERWVRIRKERNELLAESDGLMARANERDSKVQEWKTYRQALRDVPNKQADPRSIEWPVKPKHNVP